MSPDDESENIGRIGKMQLHALRLLQHRPNFSTAVRHFHARQSRQYSLVVAFSEDFVVIFIMMLMYHYYFDVQT